MHAQKVFWDMCGSGDCFGHLGLPYHPRRGSDKRQIAGYLLADIVAAFDKLDGAQIKFLPFTVRLLTSKSESGPEF